MGLFKRKHKQPQPICGCKHHLSFHKPEGPCSWTVKREHWQYEVVRDANGEPSRDNMKNVVKVYQVKVVEIPCDCQQYYGPEPISSLMSYPPHIRALLSPPGVEDS